MHEIFNSNFWKIFNSTNMSLFLYITFLSFFTDFGNNAVSFIGFVNLSIQYILTELIFNHF